MIRVLKQEEMYQKRFDNINDKILKIIESDDKHNMCYFNSYYRNGTGYFQLSKEFSYIFNRVGIK